LARSAPRTVNVHEAKTQLSKLLESVEAGDDVVIARAGRPVARLVRYEPPRRHIGAPGRMAGEAFWIADDFDAPLDDQFDILRDPDTPVAPS
jgi:prevent-host-death family protein